MIHEKEPITSIFVSAPSDMVQLNCAAYIAGIIAGILNGASFVSGAAGFLPWDAVVSSSALYDL
jgi:hypothetical protein